MLEQSSILGNLVGGVASMASMASSTALKVAESGVGIASNLAQTATQVADSAIQTSASLASSAVGVASNVASSAVQSSSQIAQFAVGTAQAVVNQSLGLATSSAQNLLGEVSSIAAGSLGIGTGLISDTMNVAKQLASSVNSSSNVQAILGDVSEQLSKCCGGCCVWCSAASSLSSAQQQAFNIASQCMTQASNAISNASYQVLNGIAILNTLDAILGSKNGASNLLQASLQKALDMTMANMMKKIVSAINTAHGMTHPMFIALFQMTWNENKQWLPKHIADDIGDPGDGSTIPKSVYDIIKEIPEYFDFVQKVMGGAIAEIMYSTEDIVNGIWATVNSSISLGVDASLNISIPLQVHMMSISKQIDDVMRKIYAIKELIRAKAKLILEKLKKLEAPELYICKPKEFELILWTLMEAEFIMNNLPIVLDKILEYFMNMFVAEFCKYADQIIAKIFEVWKKVVEIVPPLQDLVELAWAIPNQADACCNLALNAAIQAMWPMVQPYIQMPYECINQISKACDVATKMLEEKDKRAGN